MFRKIAMGLYVAALLVGGAMVSADEPGKMPEPRKEHQWLQQLAGEWTIESECACEPGQPPVKSTGTETGRLLGGFWVVVEGRGEFKGTPFASSLTLGFDAKKEKYVGTWVCSMDGTLWQYEGALDATGKILTLETEGDCPMQGKRVKVRETIEIKSKDLRVFTSKVELDGKWVTMATVTSRRKG